MIKINDLQIKNDDFVVTPAGFTLKHYANVFTNASTYLPMLRSSVYSVLAAAGSVLFMMIVAITVINHKKNKFIQTLESFGCAFSDARYRQYRTRRNRFYPR